MLSPRSFEAVSNLFHRVSGIRLTEAKRALVTGRLNKLAQAYGAASLDDYIDALTDGRAAEEMVKVIDKLTTNETYFFREPQHFDFLASHLAQRRAGRGELRVWSAASSSGEEAYSLAMLLADKLGPGGWQVVGTDLSTTMVENARRALYPMDRARHLPREYLRRYCLKGQGEYEGHLLISRELRAKVQFECGNLTQPLPKIGQFDLIFLRNVLIYFDPAGKADIVRRVLTHLQPDGLLFTGHAESLGNLGLPLRTIGPAIHGHG
ncbi:MAG: methyltransferase domain-containing protein [Burkholderiaceae bacterium]|nr:methyltransferase domain-containing protein [Burkholderiaceae bacterium]